jgi:hypothetical protein
MIQYSYKIKGEQIMGCLFKLLFLPFTLLFDVIELIFEEILEGWFTLMCWIVPTRHLGQKSRVAIKIIIGIFSFALFLIFTIGVLGAALTEATVMDLWKPIFIPLGISILQITVGLIVRVIARKK